MQKRGYMRYQAFINSIIPDSLYLQKLFDGKGYRKALAVRYFDNDSRIVDA